MNKITIALAGRTNVGKTSLVSTLTRSNAGEIADRANVTQKGETIYHDSLLAYFTDCPGFQNALRLLEFYEEQYDLNREYPDFEVVATAFKKHYQRYQYDIEAIKALNKSDVVIYLASLETVPDDSFKYEIALTKIINPKVIAILNKYIKECRATDVKTVEARIKQWENAFKGNNIELIIFDAFWDSPIKVNKIYSMIQNTLEGDKKTDFSFGLGQFTNKQNEIRKNACEKLFQFIQEVYITCLDNNFVEQKQYNKPGYKREFEIKLKNQIATSTTNFVLEVSTLYKVASESPTASIGEIEYQVKNIVPNEKKRAEFALESAATMSGLGSLLGGAIGLAFDIFTGGASLGGGALLGARLGYGLGRASGGLIPYEGEDDLVNFAVNNTIISELVITYLAIIWGLSQVGFARRKDTSKKDVSQIEIEYLKNLIKSYSKDSFDTLNWKNPTRSEQLKIIGKFEQLLNSLETKENIYGLELPWVR